MTNLYGYDVMERVVDHHGQCLDVEKIHKAFLAKVGIFDVSVFCEAAKEVEYFDRGKKKIDSTDEDLAATKLVHTGHTNPASGDEYFLSFYHSGGQWRGTIFGTKAELGYCKKMPVNNEYAQNRLPEYVDEIFDNVDEDFYKYKISDGRTVLEAVIQATATCAVNAWKSGKANERGVVEAVNKYGETWLAFGLHVRSKYNVPIVMAGRVQQFMSFATKAPDKRLTDFKVISTMQTYSSLGFNGSLPGPIVFFPDGISIKPGKIETASVGALIHACERRDRFRVADGTVLSDEDLADSLRISLSRAEENLGYDLSWTLIPIYYAAQDRISYITPVRHMGSKNICAAAVLNYDARSGIYCPATVLGLEEAFADVITVSPGLANCSWVKNMVDFFASEKSAA